MSARENTTLLNSDGDSNDFELEESSRFSKSNKRALILLISGCGFVACMCQGPRTGPKR